MAEWVRLLAIALILSSAGTLFVACGGGDDTTTEAKEITLTGSALRDFLGTLLLTREDVPGVQEDQPEEAWETEPSLEDADLLSDFNFAEADFLGILSRPFFVRAPEGRVFTVFNGAFAFRTPSGAEAAFDFIKSADVNEAGEEFVRNTLATSFEVRDLHIEAGEDSWSLVFIGPAVVEGSPEELISAQIFFRHGPILALVGMVGFVELDEDLLRELAAKLDRRIEAGLEER